MSTTKEKFRNIAAARYVKSQVADGQSFTVEDVQSHLDSSNSKVEAHEGNTSFAAKDFLVEELENASAAKWNETNDSITDELDTLYQSLYPITDSSMKSFDLWRGKFSELNTQLEALKARSQNLLLTAEDIEGYFGYISDTFVDTSKSDVENSDDEITIDLNRELVTLGSNTSDTERLNLNDLDSSDVSFGVLTEKGVHSVSLAENSLLTNAFADQTTFWQHRVSTTQPGSVLAELKVKIANEAIDLSRIVFHAHASNENTPLVVTPMYSSDGINFSKLPITNQTASVLKKATFSFPKVQATHVKFLLLKRGYDSREDDSYLYEFGADEISFYAEGFTKGTSGTFYSRFLSIIDLETDEFLEFNRASLEVCDEQGGDTNIQYYLGATNDASIAPSGMNWIAVSPFDADLPIDSRVAHFAEVDELDIGNTTNSGEWLQVSYDVSASGLFVNPNRDFTEATINGGTATTAAVTASGLRYPLPDNHTMILNHQFTTDVDIHDAELILFRNVGLQGNTERVRHQHRGWGFNDPYYSTYVDIENSQGLTIDVGDQPIIVDGESQTGEITIPQGIHFIEAHKRNWKIVGDLPAGEHDLDGLKGEDPLYPYNHKYLIEGYDYPSDFDGDEVYEGADLFAEFRMAEVSPFDMLRSVSRDDYTKFGLDLDTGDGDARDPSRVIIVKSDATNPDFLNERFVLRVNINSDSDKKFKYIRLRADLETETTELAPSLLDYKVKVAK